MISKGNRCRRDGVVDDALCHVGVVLRIEVHYDARNHWLDLTADTPRPMFQAVNSEIYRE